nr:unnamed protein product [Digitaria exilis]
MGGTTTEAPACTFWGQTTALQHKLKAHPEYQLMPAVAPPVAAWTNGSAIVPAGYHPAPARGAVYYV